MCCFNKATTHKTEQLSLDIVTYCTVANEVCGELLENHIAWTSARDKDIEQLLITVIAFFDVISNAVEIDIAICSIA